MLSEIASFTKSMNEASKVKWNKAADYHTSRERIDMNYLFSFLDCERCAYNVCNIQ